MKKIVSKSATNITATSGMDSPLLGGIRQVIEQARGRIQQQVNSAMVEAYWHIGRLIVEHDQKGEQRADYGKQQLQQLATKLTAEFGKGFDLSNLRRMRSFYNAFPIQGAVRPELSWTHYRYLIAIENHQARQWYLQESITQNWSARTLDRQIGVLYYERLLSSQDKAAVMQEAQGHALALANNPKDLLRAPIVRNGAKITRYLFRSTRHGS